MRTCPFDRSVKCDNPNAWELGRLGLDVCEDCPVFKKVNQQTLEASSRSVGGVYRLEGIEPQKENIIERLVRS